MEFVGRGNSHRERDRQSDRRAEAAWGDDTPPSPSLRSFRQQTPQRDAGPAVLARVKWFNSDKGFGFVEVIDGTSDAFEAFVHVRAVEAAGHTALEPSTTIVARIGPGPKGPQVAEIISIDSSTAVPAPPQRGAATRTFAPAPDRPSRPGASAGPAPDRDGMVKWFDSVKGFGFVTVEGESNDLFVHISVLARSGLSRLEPGQRVRVAIVEGRKGAEVGALALP